MSFVMRPEGEIQVIYPLWSHSSVVVRVLPGCGWQVQHMYNHRNSESVLIGNGIGMVSNRRSLSLTQYLHVGCLRTVLTSCAPLACRPSYLDLSRSIQNTRRELHIYIKHIWRTTTQHGRVIIAITARAAPHCRLSALQPPTLATPHPHRTPSHSPPPSIERRSYTTAAGITAAPHCTL